MINHPLVRGITTFGIILIFSTLRVSSHLILPNESTSSLRLIDVETNISPIPVLFLKKKTAVVVEGLGWLLENGVSRKIDNAFVHKSNDDSRLIYTTFVNERQVANGTIELSGYWNKNTTKGLFPSIDVGVIEVDNVGLQSIRVDLYSVLNGDIVESTAALNIRSYREWTASIPIFLQFGLFLVFNVHIIHSLFLAMFIGSWIIEGSIIHGFRSVLDTYLVQAATESAHVSILLFIMGVSTLMTMVKRSGGTKAVLSTMLQYSSRTRVAQLGIFVIGVAIFFDPFVSTILVGKVFGSVFNAIPLSSEKIAFLIDTTAAPVASMFPKSTWLVFAGDLIQREIQNMTENEEIGSINGYSLVLSSIRYQYYPCLLLGLALMQILTGREMGPILEAENRARLSYNKTNYQNNGGQVAVQQRSWNWYIPVALLNVFLWIAFSLASYEDTDKQDQFFWATTWLTSVVGTIVLTQMLFTFQRKNGNLPIIHNCFARNERNRIPYLTDTFPSASGSASVPYNPSSQSEDNDTYLKAAAEDHRKMLELNNEEKAKGEARREYLGCLKEAPLLNLQEGIACVVHGIATVIPITLSLVFAWATSLVYITLGIDRIILSWILSDSLSTEILPVTVFLAAFLLSLIMGSSWCSISILIPGTILPLLDSLDGDSKILVLTVASILSGSAAGDHIGPFSETTILSAIVTGIEVRKHFLTQAPYALFVFVLSVLVGTIPVSYNGYPEYVGHIIGIAVLTVFIIFLCRKVEGSKSSSPKAMEDEQISNILRSMLNGKGGKTCDESSVTSSNVGVNSSIGNSDREEYKSKHMSAEVMLRTSHQGMEVVKLTGAMPSVRRSNNLRSFKSKLKEISDERCDPVLGLVEDGLLPDDFRSEIGQSPAENRHSSIKNENKNKKRLIEATIKKAEQDGNLFSDSLRTFLRTAEQKLGNILVNNENLEISGSGSVDSTGDDSLDHLMMDIAAKGWRNSINNLLGDEATLTSMGEEYTTDGGSTLQGSDDSATATSSTLCGHGQSTYFTANGDATSCTSSSTGPSDYSTGVSRLINPLEFNKSRQSLPLGWEDNEEFAFLVDDIFSATDYSKASF